MGSLASIYSCSMPSATRQSVQAETNSGNQQITQIETVNNYFDASAEETASLKQRIRDQLNEINPELLKIIDGDRHPTPVMVDSGKLNGLAKLKRENPEFINYFQYEENGSTAIGGGIIGGHIHDIDSNGTLNGINWNYHTSLKIQ